MIEQIHHVAITVRDLEETIEFYSKLGFDVVSRNEYPKMNIVFLQSNEAALEVFCPKASITDSELSDTDLGIKHIALLVEDIEAEYKKLVEKGIEFQSPPRKLGTGNIVAFFKDPNGIVLHLHQK